MKNRFELRNGKFGHYFHDTKCRLDMSLQEVAAALNQASHLEDNFVIAAGAIRKAVISENISREDLAETLVKIYGNKY